MARNKVHLDPDEVIETYKRVKSIQVVSVMYGCDSKRISKILKDNNISLRKPVSTDVNSIKEVQKNEKDA